MPSVWKKALLGRVARLWPNRFTLFLAALAVLGAVLVLLHEVTYGVALSWDSVTYIATARNLLAGNGFTLPYNGTNYVDWAPLFPMLLALASLFVFDPHNVAGLVNAAAFGLTIFVAGLWLRSRIEPRFLVVWGGLAVMLSPPLVKNATFAMTEAVFILFATLALVETEKCLNTGRRSFLVYSAIFTALACLTRYIGVSIVITVLLLLVFRRNKTFLEKARHIAVYSLISVMPIGIWMLRNVLLSGTLTGHSRSSPTLTLTTFRRTCQQTLDALAGWVFPLLNPIPAGAAAAVGMALLALAIAVGYGLLRSRRKAETGTDWNALMPFGAFALIYLALFVVAASSTPIQGSFRHFCPAYIPLLFVAVFALDKLLRHVEKRRLLGTVGDWLRARTFIRGSCRISLLAVVVAVALSLWLAGSAIVTARGIQYANGDGLWSLSLSSARFANSEVLQYMRAHPVTGRVYSNDFFPVYIHTDGLAKYDLIPDKQRLAQAVREWAAADYDVHIVWLYNLGWRIRDNHHLEIRALPGVETVANLADGAIFRITPGPFGVDSYLANKEGRMNEIIKAAGEPIIGSNYNVYMNENWLTYAKDSCSQNDIDKRFFLHLIPVDKNDLPAHRIQYGYDNLDFDFMDYGILSGDRCVAMRPLPEYDISHLRTGQWVPGEGPVWEDSFSFDE